MKKIIHIFSEHFFVQFFGKFPKQNSNEKFIIYAIQTPKFMGKSLEYSFLFEKLLDKNETIQKKLKKLKIR